MLILGLNLGLHGGAAALFDNYNLIAAVQQERITRVKVTVTGLIIRL